MKIGDIVYLAEPVEWHKTPDGDWNEHTYPAGTPVKIIGDSGYRGLDIEFIETGVQMLECGPFVKFKDKLYNMQEKLICVSNPTEVDNYLEEGWTIKNISATKNNGAHCCYVHLVKNQNHENRNSSNS